VARIRACRQLQKQRSGKLNSDMSAHEIETFCVLDDVSEQFLELAVQKLKLSARAHHRILKIARTIEDMDGREAIAQQDLAEAISYRRVERFFRG
jgi:magnesium chelatase family protein